MLATETYFSHQLSIYFGGLSQKYLSGFALFFSQDNLVGTVVVISLLIWIPASCLISWIDRQRAESDQKEWEWRRQDELIHPEDKRRIINIRVPRRTVSLAAANPLN